MSPRPNSRRGARWSRYKVVVDADEGQRRREDNKLENLLNMISGIGSDDISMQLEYTRQFRKQLSKELNPPIEEVIHSGVVPRFVEFLSWDAYPELQFEAAWALTNIASGTSENTKAVVDYGSVPIFVRLLSSPSDDVREQAVWALGNIAGDSPKHRDLVLGHGALGPLLQRCNEHENLSMLRNATWTLSNFCRGTPQPQFKQSGQMHAGLFHISLMELITKSGLLLKRECVPVLLSCYKILLHHLLFLPCALLVILSQEMISKLRLSLTIMLFLSFVTCWHQIRKRAL